MITQFIYFVCVVRAQASIEIHNLFVHLKESAMNLAKVAISKSLTVERTGSNFKIFFVYNTKSPFISALIRPNRDEIAICV